MTTPSFVAWQEHDATRTPVVRARAAVSAYMMRHGPKPAELHCHHEDAAAIGTHIEGVPVIGDGTARNVYLAGPVPDPKAEGRP